MFLFITYDVQYVLWRDVMFIWTVVFQAIELQYVLNENPFLLFLDGIKYKLEYIFLASYKGSLLC